MELVGTNSLLAVLCVTVLVLCPFVKGGCQEQLMQNSGFMECILGSTPFFTSLASSGTDSSNPDGIFELICSPEGKAALTCMLGYMKDCPELSSGSGNAENPMAALGSIEGFDMQMFMEEGGLDGACAMMIGPCSEVKKCYMMPMGSPEGGRIAKRGAPSSTNYYRMFHTHSAMMCGVMKEQMSCMLKALDKCPDSVVNKVEAEFEKAINISMPDTYGVVSFKDTKHFIQKTCPKIPKNFAEDSCTMGVYVSQNFTTCNENVTMKYSKQKSCAVHELSKQCITDNVQPKCGKEAAMFLAQNTHMIFPGIPDDCEDSISGSDMKTTSFGLLLISTLFTLLYML